MWTLRKLLLLKTETIIQGFNIPSQSLGVMDRLILKHVWSDDHINKGLDLAAILINMNHSTVNTADYNNACTSLTQHVLVHTDTHTRATWCVSDINFSPRWSVLTVADPRLFSPPSLLGAPPHMWNTANSCPGRQRRMCVWGWGWGGSFMHVFRSFHFCSSGYRGVNE